MFPTAPQAIINLEALTWNYRFLRNKAAPAETAAAIKANGYGLGVLPVARALYSAGCRTFFTAHFSEALAVRAELSECRIAVLHGLDESEFKEASLQHITPVINQLCNLERWTAFGRQLGTRLPAFIHLDTGMNRLGLSPIEQIKLAENHSLLEGLNLVGWISHFACAENFNDPMTPNQLHRLKAVLERLPKAPVSLCNSSGIFWGQDYLFDLVRPGVALYGVNPTPAQVNPMRSVLTLQAPILQVRAVDANMTVGYGASHRCMRSGRVATLALGYADGYHRALSNQGTVMLASYPAPLIGRISMDLITIDVTDVPENVAYVGAPVTLIGEHRSVDQVAAEAGMIGYEVLTSLGSRVQRVYQGAGV